MPGLLENAENVWTLASEGALEDLKQLLLPHSPLDANCQDEFGYTPLMAAVSYSHYDLVRLLVSEYKGNVNLQDIEGDACLHLCENESICRLLLEFGADPHLRNSQGLLPIETAWHESHHGVVEVLREFTPEFRPVVITPAGSNDEDMNEDDFSHLFEDYESFQQGSIDVDERITELLNAESDEEERNVMRQILEMTRDHHESLNFLRSGNLAMLTEDDGNIPQSNSSPNSPS